MKRLLAMLLLLSLAVLVGCSGIPGVDTPKESVRDDMFEGIHGTYEWIETIIMEKEEGLKEGVSHLYHVIRYTNTTNQAVSPGEAVFDEMELQHETDITLNNVYFQGPFYGPPPVKGTPPSEGDIWEGENSEIVKNTYRNIRPGVTVDFVMETRVDDEMLDSIYLRNRIKTTTDTVVYERKISISNPELND